MKELFKQFERIEFLLAIVIAILLVTTLLTNKLFAIPTYTTGLLLLVFVGIRLYDITKQGGTIFEDYVALAIIMIFGIVNFAARPELSPIITTVLIITILYSIGIIPWVQYIIKSKNVISFIISYAMFILMIIFFFSGVYFSSSDLFYTQDNASLTYENALYFSTITFTTVGYGDIVPLGTNKLVASIQAILGSVLNIAFIGYIFASKRFK